MKTNKELATSTFCKNIVKKFCGFIGNEKSINNYVKNFQSLRN